MSSSALALLSHGRRGLGAVLTSRRLPVCGLSKSYTTTTAKYEHESDYVIVGAGSAGCVLANRLSEAGHSVLVLEAGPSDVWRWDSWKIHMPAALVWCVPKRLP